MGTCNVCCQERENILLNPSVISSQIIFSSPIESQMNVESTPQISMNLFDEDTLAQLIQITWKSYKAKKLLNLLRLETTRNHGYFTMEELKETVSSSPLVNLKPKEHPKFRYKSGGTYTGEWLGGFRHGYGIMKWPDDSIYEGTWQYGFASGMGKFSFSDGESFHGKWISPFAGLFSKATDSFILQLVSDCKDGYRNLYLVWLNFKKMQKKSLDLSMKLSKTSRKIKELHESQQESKQFVKKIKKLLVTSFDIGFEKRYKRSALQNGNEYSGEWDGDKRSGIGKMIWANLDIYEGYWLEDLQNGYGRNLWNDGSQYIGCFKKSVKDGLGEYIWADGTVYLGEWKNNQIDGIGFYTWPDNRKYLGEWKLGRMDGFGVFEYTDGKRYEGGWENGKRHGKGYTIFPGDNRVKNIWEHGRIVN